MSMSIIELWTFGLKSYGSFRDAETPDPGREDAFEHPKLRPRHL
jgi:hypothetical protein